MTQAHSLLSKARLCLRGSWYRCIPASRRPFQTTCLAKRKKGFVEEMKQIQAEKAGSVQQQTSDETQQPAADAQKPLTDTTGPTQYSQQQQPRVQPQLAETPQVVVDRMFARMIGFAGIPVATGIALLALLYYLKVQVKLDYPYWVAYVSQTLCFGGGLLGITYGILSTSWDPARPGSFWGWTEFQGNLPLIMNRNKQR